MTPSTIFKLTDHFFNKHVPLGLLRTILKNRLAYLKKNRSFQTWAPCIDVPYYLSLGLNNSLEQSQALGVLATILFLGCDLLDDLHDGDLSKNENQYSSAHLSLASAALLTASPPLVLKELMNLSASQSLSLLQTIADALLTMAEGQLKDLSSVNKITLKPDEVETTVLKKSGEELSLFCRLAARLASTSPKIEQKCADFGKFFGTALQISSDVFDLFMASHSKDLQHGTLTLPLVLHLERIKNKSNFLQLLSKAKSSKDAREKIKKNLTSSGSIEHTMVLIEFYCEKARQVLKSLKFTPKIHQSLENLIKQTS